MRLFKIGKDAQFVEFAEEDFKDEHEEQVMESWLENNQDSIVEDGRLLVIGRQVTTNLNTFIDLLAIDRKGSLAVVELKRDRTPRDTLAQALEYASFVEHLSYDDIESILQEYLGDENVSLSEYHRSVFELDSSEAVSFNKDQRIVIVGQCVTSTIRQTANFLRRKGIKVTCVEFKYFKTDSDEEILSCEIVVGQELAGAKKVTTSTLPKVNRSKFLGDVSGFGKPIFEALLGLADSHRMPIHWGSKGFSINVDVGGSHVALCYCYPPDCVFRESIYLGFDSIGRKVKSSTGIVEDFRSRFNNTGLFQPAGIGLKFVINRNLTQDEIDSLAQLFLQLGETVIKTGLA